MSARVLQGVARRYRQATSDLTPVRVFLLFWLCWCFLATAQHVPVWQTDLSLWAYAVERAPWLPRTRINHGKALIAAGERERGIQVALVGYELERRRQDARRLHQPFTD